MSVGDSSNLTAIKTVRGATYWQRAQLDVAAMLVGLSESAMDMIVSYAKERQTFGRPIGAYQAVRHPCADMAVRIEVARSQLLYSAAAMKEQHADLAMHIAATRLLAERAARDNSDANIQLHGGIGVTDEHDAHLLMKRSGLLARLFSSSKHTRESLLDLGGDSPAMTANN
jgi:alkylation response protein AidB-like acyl-CoA dehydrogenase